MRSRAHRNSGEHKSELRYWWRGNGSKKRWVTTHTHCSRGEEVKEGNQARRRREGHAPQSPHYLNNVLFLSGRLCVSCARLNRTKGERKRQRKNERKRKRQRREEAKRGTPQKGGWGQSERMRLQDPQTRIPLPPSLCGPQSVQRKVRDKMSKSKQKREKNIA